MGNDKLRTIPVKDTDAPEFAEVARKVSWPAKDADQAVAVLAGDEWVQHRIRHRRRHLLPGVEPLAEPSDGFDRHLNTEELFVCLEGEYVMPMAPCRKPDDPNDEPLIEDLIAFRVRAGDAYVLKPNVWHNGGWPTKEAGSMRYIMVLSGHRAGEGHQGRVDHIMKKLPDDQQVIPEGLA